VKEQQPTEGAELTDGYRQWYASCPCCMEEAVPDIKRLLDEESAAVTHTRPSKSQ